MAILFLDETKPAINFLGITEWSGYELASGFTTGLFRRDIKTEWGQCFGIIPTMISKFSVLFNEFTSLSTK